jgi:hypothetical protein
MHSARQSGFWFRIAGLLALFSAFAGPLEAKSKDDVVVMKDGDKFTGEIKKLENGILYFKASYMVDSVKLDWMRVERLESKDRFKVSFTSGKLLTGVIGKLPDRDFAVQAGSIKIQAQPPEVVTISPVEDIFWAQLTGSIDYGFNFTGGNDTIQSNLSGDVNYAADRWRIELTGGSVFSHQSGASNSGRNNLDVLYIKSISDHWFLGTTATLLSSDQQDLTLRTTAGGGIGRDFLRSGTAGLLALAGVVYSREQYSSTVGDQPRKNAEGLLQIQFSKSTFRRLQFNGSLALHPNLTTLGRVRVGAESSLKLEIVRNLYWKLSFYENYDNRPPVAAPKNDFGTSTSVGWTF